MTVNDEDLYDQAACRGMDPRLFFLVRSDGGRIDDEVKAACDRCCVRLACLEVALSFSESDDSGWWGGTSAKQRRAIRRRRRKGAA